MIGSARASLPGVAERGASRGAVQRGVERGSGSVLALAVLGATALLLALLLPVVQVSVLRHRAAVAADAAALVGAEVLRGRLSGEPCVRAAELARVNGGSLQHCSTQGDEVLVRVGTSWFGWSITATARAGAP